MLRRLVEVRRQEVPALLWSFTYFFCLLAAYYLLRPLRDEMGIQGGVQNLPWAFTGTFAVMLAAVPLFGWAASRLRRRRLIPVVYGFLVLNLLAFQALFALDVDRAGVALAFFIWVSVFNLFAVSVFWSFMADLFDQEQAHRLFGVIASGGSAGALVGPLLAATLAHTLGPLNLLPVAAALLAAALVCADRLGRWAGEGRGKAAVPPLGGGVWEGVRQIAVDRHLQGITLYLVLFTATSTFLYFQQARIVADSIHDSSARTALFAAMDLAVNLLTLAAQVWMTGRVVSRYGVGIALALLPAFTAVGFAVLAVAPILPVLLGFQVLRRAGDYALARPAREMLFTRVGRSARYKSKNVIDTLVYRGGDAASGWLFAGLKALGLGASWLAALAIPLCLVWLATGWRLGRQHEQPQGAVEPSAGANGGSDATSDGK